MLVLEGGLEQGRAQIASVLPFFEEAFWGHGDMFGTIDTTGLGGRPPCGQGPNEDPMGRLLLTADCRPAILSGLG